MRVKSKAGVCWQEEDDEEGPLTVHDAPCLRHQRHVLEDTLDPSLPLEESQKPEGGSSGSAADAAEPPAAGPVQAQGSGPRPEMQPKEASEPNKPNNDLAQGAADATLEYTVVEAADNSHQPEDRLQAEQLDQAAEAQMGQAAGQLAEVGRPSTQEPDQAAGAWTPLSPQEGWRTKHKTWTPDRLPAAQPQGKHFPSGMPRCPV